MSNLRCFTIRRKELLQLDAKSIRVSEYLNFLTKCPNIPAFDSTHFRIKITSELILDGKEFHEVTPTQLLRQRRNNLFVGH